MSTPTLAILSTPEDAPFVARLASDLSAAGYQIADIASERLHEDPCTEPGELRRRLEPAHAVLVVLSPAASQSPQVRCEIEFARLLDPAATTLRMVPVLVSAADVPHSLKDLHTIYFTAGPYDAALARLKDHLSTKRDEQGEEELALATAGPAPIAAAPRLEGAARVVTPESAPTVPLAPAQPAPPAVVGNATTAAPMGAPSSAAPAPASASTAPAAERKRRPFWKALFGRR